MNRIFEAWYGAQASGKTYQLRRRAAVLSRRPSIRRVIVLAPPGEWRDLAAPVSLGDLSAELWDNRRGQPPVLPRVELGDRESLEAVVQTATAWGDCALVLDEAAFWIPSGLSGENLRRMYPATTAAILRGRHLARMDGQDRPIHLLFASQYGRTVHHLLNEQASTIMVARPDGGLSFKWISEFSSPRVARQAEELGRHQWLAIRGRDPRRG
jgi:hypothetical protein